MKTLSLHAFWLVLFAVSLLGWKLGSARTLSFHESLVVTGAQEMLATGDWLVPRIGGEPWLEKPPLPQWLTALFGRVLGLEPFYARLPFALCGLVGVWLLYDLVRAKRGVGLGLLAGMVQATTVYFLTYARLAEPDIVLWVLILGCFRIAAAHLVRPLEPIGWHNSKTTFFVLLGLTQLVKGPMFGPVLLLGPLGLYLLGARQLAWLLAPIGWLLALGLGVAWPLAILQQFPEARELWFQHTLGRVAGASTINPEPFWYYLTSIPWQLLPWTFFLLPALWPSLRRAWRRSDSLDRLLWLWFLVPLALLSIPSAKHHHYLIHALPPCAVWGADGLLRCRSLFVRLTRSVIFWPGTVGILALVGMSLAPWLQRHYGFDLTRDLLGLGAAASVWLVGVMFLARTRGYAVGLFAGIWLGSLYLHAVWVPWTDNYREETDLMGRFVARTAPTEPLAVMGMNSSRALYYTGRTTHELPVLEDLHRLLDQRGSCVLLTFSRWEPILQEMGQLTRLETGKESAYNRWVRRPALGLYRLQR